MIPQGDVRPFAPTLHEVHDRLLVGEYPRVVDLEWLRDTHGVGSIVSLQDSSDFELKRLDRGAVEARCKELELSWRNVPIADYNREDLRRSLDRAVDAVSAEIASGATVYLHCNAGFNRAPTVAIAYLVRECGFVLDDAVAHVRGRRPCSPYVEVLRD